MKETILPMLDVKEQQKKKLIRSSILLGVFQKYLSIRLN